MPSTFLRWLLCCHHEPASSSPSAHDEPFLHANRPITVATPASPASSTRRRRPPPAPSSSSASPSPSSSPPASIRPDPLRRRHPSPHYPSSTYSREEGSGSADGPGADKYPSWFTRSETVRKMALGPWHPDNLRVEFAAGCRPGAAAPGRSIYKLPKRG